MRSDDEILGYILRARQEKIERHRIESERAADELAHKKVFFQAARSVLTRLVLPTMERMVGLCARASLRAEIVDTGAFYLAGSVATDMMCRFQMPIVSRPEIEMPLAVSFKAVFPEGMAIYYSDVGRGQADAKGAVDSVELTDLHIAAIEDHLLQVVANYLHES
ncbi:MAG: hypothetical protein FJX02_11555 [Alphaproteobacteria bacterium]|nr:hypothetical protein [Alphaproteobacteria bacterium]